jgi:hypothetical protein
MNFREYAIKSSNMCVQNLPQYIKFKPLGTQSSIIINIFETGTIKFSLNKPDTILNYCIKYLTHVWETCDKKCIITINVKKNTYIQIIPNIIQTNTEIIMDKDIFFEKNLFVESDGIFIDTIETNNVFLTPNYICGADNTYTFSNNDCTYINKNINESNNTNFYESHNNRQEYFANLRNKRPNNQIIKTPNIKDISEIKKIYPDIQNGEIAVVSVNFGSYDSTSTDIRNIGNYGYFDWFYITDNINISNNGWTILSREKYHLENIPTIHNNDPNRMYSKFYKTQLLNIESFFTKYKYIIWLDASFIIENVNFVEDILRLLNGNQQEDFFIFEHSERDSVQLEYLASITLSKYFNQNLDVQVKKYYLDGYRTGLYETGFMIYKVNQKIIMLMDDWWDEIQKYSYQCQVSLPYVLYKNNIKPYLLNEPSFKKGIPQGNGSVWRNNLVGYVRNHN